MKSLISVLLLFFVTQAVCQTMTGSELLSKSIAYHDPGSNWPTFNGKLIVSMETPDSPNRVSEIEINLPAEYFSVFMTKGDEKISYSVEKGRCTTCVYGASVNKDPNEKPCEKAKLYKNYYTYLYGLPMKLTDPGTKIHEKVGRKKFKGKEYLVLKVTYEEAVGKDVWFYYFDPNTYAMEIYQFYKGDPKKEGKNTGEYILLTEEAIVNGINMPKNRAWFYNKDDTYLGTDRLQ
ncbi:MAG: DUF6503 family protein [Altibacter sp.]|uniref:DUF6503 family protein n=1 Tax=Altibacter sp. TaxID=2024823 RepID=UPI001D40E6A0|nr:DUF6503 family protein [Altibacter sp.]MBZ0326194.1 DUF6503 family protein [Altibacter sp.]